MNGVPQLPFQRPGNTSSLRKNRRGDGIRITAKTYRLRFFASRRGDSYNRQTQYKVLGARAGTGLLNATNNTSQAATVSGIKPHASSRIVIEVSQGAANNAPNGFYYLGNLVLKY